MMHVNPVGKMTTNMGKTSISAQFPIQTSKPMLASLVSAPKAEAGTIPEFNSLKSLDSNSFTLEVTPSTTWDYEIDHVKFSDMERSQSSRITSLCSGISGSFY